MRSVVLGCALSLAGPAVAAAEPASDGSSDVAPPEASPGASPVADPVGGAVAEAVGPPAEPSPPPPPPSSPALPGAPLDRAEASLRAEAGAMAELVAVLKREVRERRLDLTTEAKLAWQAGVVDFENALERGEVGDWETAYLAAIQARTVVLQGADEAFSVAAAEPVKLALKAYLDAVEPRVEAARQLLRLRDRVDLEKRWFEARGLFQDAKTLAAVGRYDKAWGALVVSAGKLDQIVLQSVWDRRPEAE